MADTLGAVNPLTYRGYVYDSETDLYYLQSRYYRPEVGRFINSDVFASTGQDLIGNNMFSYCGNNPVNRADNGGYFWDTVLDIFSLGLSIIDVCCNPTDPWAWAGLAGDIVDLIPFVTGVGEIARAASTTHDVIDSAYDASRMIDASSDAIDAVGDVGRKIDFYVTPNGEALPATLDGFNENLSLLECKNGKYIGEDSTGPIRIRVNEMHQDKPLFDGIPNELHTIPHFHIDRREKITSGKWIETFIGPMEMFE